jgi:hypothetical protein
MGAAIACAQTPSDTAATTPAPVKVDRASAYYHFGLAHMYIQMAASSRTNSVEYVDKAIENYRLAVQDDPQSTLLSDELSRIIAERRAMRVVVPSQLRPSGPRPAKPSTGKAR